jgi:archaellum biogenesis ATPase FlaH
MVDISMFHSGPSAKHGGSPMLLLESDGTHTPNVYEDLPAAMRKATRWVVWRFVLGSGQKPRKVPFYINGAPRGQGIPLDSPEDLARLAPLEAAISALQAGSYQGLGFALGPDADGGHWQGIDLDDLPAKPELADVASDLPSYTEHSPSGRGLHAIGYGRRFETLGANGTGIEAYCQGRFFTVTADGAGIQPLCDIADFVESRLRPVHSRGHQRLDAGLAVTAVDPKTITELRSALLWMRSDDRDLWIKMGHALKTLGEAGRGLWLDWSATSDKFDPSDAAKTWDSFRPSNTGYQAVFAEAQRQDWLNPASREATNAAESMFQRSDTSTPAASAGVVLATVAPHEATIEDMLVDLNEFISPNSGHPHVIEKIIPQGEVTLLSGHGGSGKSYIALQMLVHVALGLRYGDLNVQRTKCLFFSAEDDKVELLRRVAKLCQMLGVNQSDLDDWLYLVDASELDATLYHVDHKGEASSTLWLNKLSKFVQSRDIGLTVIDNASDVFAGNEVVRTHVRGFLRTIRKQLARPNRAVVLLAHVSKLAAQNKRSSGASLDEDYSGSTAWHNSVRSRLSLDTNDKTGSTLTHSKANKGPLTGPIHLDWIDGVPTITGGAYVAPGAQLAVSLRDEAAKVKDEADKVTIIEIIKGFDQRSERVPTATHGGHSTFRTLKTALGFPKTFTAEQVVRLMRELEEEGRVFRTQTYTKSRRWVECFTCSHVIVNSARIALSDPPGSGHPVQKGC